MGSVSRYANLRRTQSSGATVDIEGRDADLVAAVLAVVDELLIEHIDSPADGGRHSQPFVVHPGIREGPGPLEECTPEHCRGPGDDVASQQQLEGIFSARIIGAPWNCYMQ